MARRRRGGAVVGLVVTVVVLGLLAVGLVVADRYAQQRVERAVAGQLQTELGTPAPPAVDIEDSPFLPGAATGSIDTVRVGADQVGATNGAALVVARTDLVLRDVTSTDRWDTMTARHAEGSARVDYDALRNAAGVPLTYAGNGQFRVEQRTSVFGLDLEAQVNGTLGLDVADQTVSLQNPRLTVAGVTLPEATTEALLRSLVRPVPVNGLPEGLTVTAIEPRDDGLHATVSGDDLPLRR